MLSSIKKLTKSSFFFTFANSIEAFSPVVLAVLMTRMISPDEYGLWILFIAFVTFIRPLVGLSINDALRMHFYEFDRNTKSQFIRTSIFLSTCITVLVVLITVVLSNFLGYLTGFNARWMPAIPIVAYLYSLFYFLLAYHQFSQQRKLFLLLHIVQASVGLIAIYFLLLNNMNWQGAILGKGIGLVVCIALGFILLIKSNSFSFGKIETKSLKKLAKFGLFYMPTGMGLVAIPLTDRLIASNFLGLEQAGYFGTAALFGSSLFVAINGFIFAWMPWLFKRLSSKNYDPKELISISIIFFILLPIVGILVTIVSKFVAPILIGDSYNEAFGLIPWSIAGVICMGYFYHNQAILHYYKAISLMSITSLFCIISNAVVSTYFAITIGLMGIFLGTVISFFLSTIMSGVFILFRIKSFDLRKYNYAK